MVLPHFGSPPRLYPSERFKDYNKPDPQPDSHYAQFIDAGLGQRESTRARFSYAGPLTETVLLGSIAVRYKKQVLRWDSEQFRFTNATEANQYVGRQYREGWAVQGL